jgi:hypothetical protein
MRFDGKKKGILPTKSVSVAIWNEDKEWQLNLQHRFL